MAEKRIYEVQYVEGLIAENERLTARDEVFLEKIIELEQQNTRLRKALDRYGEHKRICKAIKGVSLGTDNMHKFGDIVHTGNCTCGYKAALTEAEKLQDNDT
ncbi:MAG: hypothetical protein GY927_14005 [bacterium]|nr:hypothetical protein [bacterium]